MPSLSPQDLDTLATRAFAVVAGLGGVAFLVIAYRRQRTTDSAEQREETKLFTDRFTTASEHLGDEHAAVRLAGVHALARLADDAPARRDDLVQMVIDVLCAYLRMPYTTAPGANEDFEVRLTIIRIIGDHLRDPEPTRWRGKNYDFTGASFDGGDLSSAVFSGGEVSFQGASFERGTVDFGEAKFEGSIVSFAGAVVLGGTVDFFGAEFRSSIVSFTGTRFKGGTVDFDTAEFAGGSVELSSDFNGSTVSFAGTRLTDGVASFLGVRNKREGMGADFVAGTVDFTEAHGPEPRGLPHDKPDVVLLPERWQPGTDQKPETPPESPDSK